MDAQSIFNVGVGAVLAAIGWFAREIWSAVKELRDDLAHLREEIPQRYTSREDFKSAVEGMRTEMRDNFARLFDRLDRKQDK